MDRKDDKSGRQSATTKPKPRRTRIRALNVEDGNPGDRMPLAACDCDNHCGTHTNVCVVGDVEADVEACGIWG